MGKTIQVFGFPYVVAAERVKEFLEGITGHGTVYALEVKQSKGGHRAYAKVQFASNRSAEYIISLAKQHLYYGSSYLRAWDSDIDLVPRPRSYEHNMEHIVLNFGCQVSANKFSVLWNKANVTVRFGIGMKKMYFILQFSSVDYKLELSCENIWQIILHEPRGQAAKFLLIQELDLWKEASGQKMEPHN